MDLYAKYHLERGDERRELFRLLRDRYDCTVGLYPGCFVHVTPSFYLQTMTYVDTSPRARQFFRGGAAVRTVDANKTYPDRAVIHFHPLDYRTHLPLDDETVDLLVSQYAGFVSDACSRYLCHGGILVANDSHGDAGLAYVDPAFDFVGVVLRNGEQFELSTEGLGEYFVRASHTPLPDRSDLRQYLKGLGRPLRYVKSAEDYLFRKR